MRRKSATILSNNHFGMIYKEYFLFKMTTDEKDYYRVI